MNKKQVHSSRRKKKLKKSQPPLKEKNKAGKQKAQQKKRKRSKEKKRKSKRLLVDLLLAVAFSSLLIGILASFFFSLITVQGFGMIPTLRDGDRVIVQKKHRLERFDLIAFSGRNNETQVRRIIGLPGEKVEYKEDTLFIDDYPVDEKFIVEEINEAQKNGKNYTEAVSVQEMFGLSKIPENYYLVLGDNRPYATDSRHYGLIPKEQIEGVVKMSVLPLDTAEFF